MKFTIAILIFTSLQAHAGAGPSTRQAPDLSGALTVEQRRQLAAANSPEEAQSLRVKFGIAKADDRDVDETIQLYSEKPEEPEAREELRSSLRKAYYSTDSKEEREKIRQAFKDNPMQIESSGSRSPASVPMPARLTGQ